MKEIILFIIIYLCIDSIWLIGGKSLHSQMIQSVQGSKLVVDKKAALAFYLLAGCMYYCIAKPFASLTNQSTQSSSSKSDLSIQVAKIGALLGFAMYATFDLTNKAIFKNYSWKYAIMDTLWGSFAFALASYLTVCISSKLKF